MLNPAAVLHDHLDKLAPRDRAFAESLLSRHHPSPKQLYWIEKLAERVTAPPPAPVAEVDAAALEALLLSAKGRGLKYPKVRFQSATGEPIAVALAGERSRYPGSVMVSDGRFGGAFYGRITDGVLTPGRALTPTVQAALVAMAEDPAGTAAAHGHLTGSCCFCGKDLSTDESVAVGYGPVCAQKYNLPWGEKAPAAPAASLALELVP